VGEIYYRWFYDATESFGLTKTTDRWFERHVHENEAGFRDSLEHYAKHKQAGKKRLVILGDSFTAGHGIADVEKRVAHRLRGSLSDWEIHIHARPGWDTLHELKEVRKLADDTYEADAVLLAYCLNDIAAVTPQWQSILESVYLQKQPGFFVDNSY